MPFTHLIQLHSQELFLALLFKRNNNNNNKTEPTLTIIYSKILKYLHKLKSDNNPSMGKGEQDKNLTPFEELFASESCWEMAIQFSLRI